MEDIIHIGVVNFKTEWGNKDYNLKSIKQYCHKAHNRGVELIVFPETALIGYSNEINVPRSQKMQVNLAETIPGKSTLELSKVAIKYNMYIVVGMSEKDGNKIYNSAAILHPNGKIESYRKIHLPFDEASWCVPGSKPVLINTKWGPIGITICYDTYCFPELIRYYRAKGARLTLNVTACPNSPCTYGSAVLSIPAYSFINYIFIASSNLIGQEKQNHFIGGSGVIGPVIGGSKTYIGHFFNDKDSEEEGLFDGILDLSLVDKYAQIPIFKRNNNNKCDWNYKLYSDIYKSIDD